MTFLWAKMVPEGKEIGSVGTTDPNTLGFSMQYVVDNISSAKCKQVGQFTLMNSYFLATH